MRYFLSGLTIVCPIGLRPFLWPGRPPTYFWWGILRLSVFVFGARLLPSPSPPPHGVAEGESFVTVVSPKYRSTVGREASWELV